MTTEVRPILAFRNQFFVEAPYGMEVSDLESGATWVEVADRLWMGDHVHVTDCERRWYAEVLIASAAFGKIVPVVISRMQPSLAAT